MKVLIFYKKVFIFHKTNSCRVTEEIIINKKPKRQHSRLGELDTYKATRSVSEMQVEYDSSMHD